jgi:hypothetical protein
MTMKIKLSVEVDIDIVRYAQETGAKTVEEASEDAVHVAKEAVETSIKRDLVYVESVKIEGSR